MTNEEMHHVHLALDPAQYPETIEYFRSIKNFDELSSYELASGILSCDRTKAMPQELFAFVVSLYKQAISQGSVDAMNDLGALYYDGRGCCQDFTKAIHYYEMGAFRGRLGSLYKIGDMYRKGYCVEKNPAEAFKIYAHCVRLMAYDDMCDIAGPVYLRLGQLYLYGEGTDKCTGGVSKRR